MDRCWITRARRAFSYLLVLSLISATLGGPLSRPAQAAIAETSYAPTQPVEWAAYGSQWWDHFFSRVYVALDVGVRDANPDSCLNQPECFAIDVVFAEDQTCYSDGCGGMNLWYIDHAGNVINGMLAADHADSSNTAMHDVPYTSPGKHSLFTARCKWVNTDANGIPTGGCALAGAANKVLATDLIDHVQWRATSGDGSVRDVPWGDAYTVHEIPSGYPAPHAAPSHPGRCGTATCTVSLRDAGTDQPQCFGGCAQGASSKDPVNLFTGGFSAQAEDLALPGRVLPFSFTRFYNSADRTGGPLGPGWTHSYNWSLADAGSAVTIRQGDGRQESFTRNADGTYADPPNVFDTLVRNADGSFTLTMPNLVAYEFGPPTVGVAQLLRVHEPAGNQIVLAYTGPNLTQITDTVGRIISLRYAAGSNLLIDLTDPLGRRVSYAYDHDGRLVGVTDKLANASVPDYRAAVLADSPTGYWKLDESTGTTITDERGLSNGTASAGVVRGAPGIGQSLSTAFNNAEYGAIPSTTATNFGTGDFAVEAWVFRTGSGDYYPVVVSKRPWITGGAEPGWAITIPAADPTKVAIRLHNLDFSESFMQTASGLVTAGTWHHLALSYTSADQRGRLYVDGALALTTPPTDGVTGSSSSAALTIGRDNVGSGHNYYVGRIDEVAVYAHPLTAAQVQAHVLAAQAPAVSWQYRYAGFSSHLVSITDPDGRARVHNTYDAQGRVVAQRDGLNALTTLSYSAPQTVVVDPRAYATTYTFDSLGRELSETAMVSGAQVALAYNYDAAGNRLSGTDRNGNRIDLTYDTRGNVLTKSSPSPDGTVPRPVTTFQYDSRNNLIQVTDALGFVTTSTYDPATNALTTTRRQIDATTYATTTYGYGDPSSPGLPTQVASPRGNITTTADAAFATTLTYDSQGNLASRTDPDGARTTYAYDAIGRQVGSVDPDGNVTGATPAQHMWAVTYDANDRENSRTDPLGHLIRTGYDKSGDRTSVTDHAGNITSYGYDANARLISTTQRPDPVGQPSLVYATGVTRDANGNATSIRQANGVVTDYAFDELDRLRSVTTHPDSSTNLVTAYVLDGVGQPMRKTTGDGVAVNYAYDALGRLTAVTGPTVAIGYQYDAVGRRTRMTDATGVTTYAYDGLARMLQAGGMTYAYDRDGNRTQLSDSGSPVTYAYSNGGRLMTVTDWAARVSTYAYKASGLVSSVTYPNGMVATYAYDNAQRLVHLKNATATATINEFDYSLDPEGNRLTGDNPNTYDGLNRLVSAGGEAFTFDAASNIATYLAPGATIAATRTDDGANRLTSDGARPFIWSAADRLVGRGSDTFTYDELGRMTSASVGTAPLAYPDDPTGNIDVPSDGATVDPRAPISFVGWAIDRNASSGTGVDTVTLYLDGGPGQGTLLGTATYGDSRPDVGTYFNDHRYDTSGWHFGWTVPSSVPLGGHTAVAIVHSSVTGTTQMLTRYVVLALPYPDDPRGNIDGPADGATVTGGTVQIFGWGIDRNAASGAGVDGVTVYLDGTDAAHLLGTAAYGDSRPDVGTYFNDHRLDNSGWHLDWNTTALPLGSHTIHVVLHSSVMGRTATLSRTVTRTVPYPDDPRGNIDGPAEGSNVSRGAVSVFGWAIDRNAPTGTGVDAVTVYLDGGPGTGALLGSATLGDSRPDVGTYFNDHRLDTSGWHFSWNTSALPGGPHTLYVVLHGPAYDRTATLTRTVGGNLPYPADPAGNIDAPGENQAVGSGPLTLQGWAIDRNGSIGTGVDNVTVYVDGTDTAHRLGSATLGDGRPDVGTYFGDSRFNNAGWHFATDTTSLSYGNHTYSVMAHSSVTGRTTILTRTVTKPLPYPGDPRGNIDDPADGATVAGTVRVDGWAVDRNAATGTGIDTVSVYLDGTSPANLLGTATYGDSRPDVATFFGDPRLDSSGFHYDWSTTGVTAGTHTLQVFAHSSVTGATVTITRSVTIPVAAIQQRGSIVSAPLTTFTYTYDGDGLIRSRSDGTSTATFVWDVSTELAQLSRTDQTRVVNGLGPLYIAGEPGAITELARDGLGSVRTEVTGAQSKVIAYSAYGDATAKPSLLGYAGQLSDPTGMLYMRARWYDPASAQFTTADEIAGGPASPITLNRYGYAAQNPLRYTDPSGRCGPWCVGAAIGAASYLGSLALLNLAVYHKPIERAFDGFQTNDFIISTVAGALTGGTSAFVKGAAVLGGRGGQIVVGAGIGFMASTMSMATRPSDPSRPPNPWDPAIGAAGGAFGAALLPDPHGFGTIVGALAGSTVLNAVQSIASEHTSGGPGAPIELIPGPSGK